MPVKFQLVDGKGNGNVARINDEGEINAVIHTHPPRGEEDWALPFRQYFTDDGTSAGNEDMSVAASGSAPKEFWVKADQKLDIYIQSAAVIISDAGASLGEFGSVPALSNGVELEWRSNDLGSTLIADKLTTNFEFVRLSGGSPSFGNGNGAFRANNVVGTSEAYIPYIDFQEILGMPWGFRLRAGTEDKLVWKVQDDISSLDRFDIIAYGIRF